LDCFPLPCPLDLVIYVYVSVFRYRSGTYDPSPTIAKIADVRIQVRAAPRGFGLTSAGSVLHPNRWNYIDIVVFSSFCVFAWGVL
jgi:hypothetical protein